MKKRLFRNLLMLGLLLIALTAAVSAAQYTADVNGKKVRTNIVIEYFCNSCGKTHALEDSDYTINSFQARTTDGTAKPLAEWKYGDGLVLSASVKATTFTACPQKTDITAQTFDSVVIEAAYVGYYCHKQYNFIIVSEGNFKFRFTPVEYLFTAEHHAAGPNSCEEDGYKQECWLCPCCGQCFDEEYTATANVIPDNIIPKLGHSFDANGVCTREGCGYHAEAKLTTTGTYYATAAEAIDAAAGTDNAVLIVSYAADKTDPIILNKIVDLTVNNGVTVPEIRLEALSGKNTDALMNINNYGTVRLFSSAAESQNPYPGVFIFNHNTIDGITVSNAVATFLNISNTPTGTIGEINIPQTDITSQMVQITNNGKKINTLSACTGTVKLGNGTGSYGKIQNRVGSVDSLLNTGCYLYFPNGQKWADSCAESTISDVIVSKAPFTVKLNRNGTALTPSNGSYTVDNVNVGDTVSLSAEFELNTYGLKADEAQITSHWYYKGENKTAADGKTLTLENIQYGAYDLIFEASESTYGFTTSVSVTVNVNPPTGKTAISLKTQLTSDDYTKVYDGTTNASAVLPPIEFQLADGREIRIPANCYTFKAEYKSPDCISDNKIIVEVTLTEEGKKYYTLTGGKIEVAATITPYDGEQIFSVELNYDPIESDGDPSIGKPVLKYLNLIGYLFDSDGKQKGTILTPESGFKYSFYHLRPGSDTPDPELDELLTADSVFTYSGAYRFYAVVEPSLNYKGCITNDTYFTVQDNYQGSHTHDQKTYEAWDGGSLSIASGGTAARYLSGAQPNVNVELVLGQNKTLDLCLYNKDVHVIGSSYDQIYLAGGSTLVLSDCTKTGKIIGSKVKSGSGGVAYVKNGTLSVYDVKLTGGSASTGGAVTVDAKGVLNIYGGEISGNTVTSGKGGAIYIKSGGIVNIYGGTIKDNHVYSGNGGAIYVENGATLNLYGGTITGNTASKLGGGIYVEAGGKVTIQGAPVVTGNTAGGKANNLYVCVGSNTPLLTISGEITDGTKLGVSTDASYPMLLAGSTQDYSAYFTPDDPDAFVIFSGSALTLCAKPSATLVGDTLTVSTGSNYKPNAFVLFVAEYDADGRLLAVYSANITPESGTYTFKVQPGAKIKCLLLRTDTYSPLLGAFSPNA